MGRRRGGSSGARRHYLRHVKRVKIFGVGGVFSAESANALASNRASAEAACFTARKPESEWKCASGYARRNGRTPHVLCGYHVLKEIGRLKALAASKVKQSRNRK